VAALILLSAVFLTVILKVVPRGCVVGERLCEGLRIEGVPVRMSADVPGLLQQKARDLAARPLRISVAGVQGAERSFKLGELGVSLDVERMNELASAVGHTGSFIDRLSEARRARRGEIDITRSINIDTGTAEAALTGLKDQVDELPIAARVNLTEGGVIPEMPGHFLDLSDAIEEIRSAAYSGTSEIELRRVELLPRVTRDFAEHVAIGEPLSRFQTWFSRRGDQETRARNIDTAAARLDGVILLPKELFSFNAAVGPRTVDNGFSKGWEIFKGEMVEGIGGGTCQVASTFHAAAVFAGLDIIERLPHSRPSAYITMGLDATVVYPIVDLKLRNPYDFPIVVHSWVDGGQVTFELLGKERPARVTFGREVLATRPYTRKVDEKPGIPRDRAIRKQHGIRGFKVLRTRTLAYRDGTSRHEQNIDFYPPTAELYLVAPGVDPDTLLPPFIEPPDPFEAAAEQDPGPGAVSPPSPPVTPAAAPAASAIPAVAAPSTTPVAVANAAEGATVPASVPPTQPPAAAPADTRIIEGPGVHPPRAEQIKVPKKVVIHTPPLKH
jgi:vancomycin resistance protein YoaR